MDARKRKDEAAEALARGKLARAAELYAELAADHPEDPQLLVRLGEVQRKRGKGAEAVAAFLAAAARFTTAGLLLRAIAAYKLVLEIDPAHREADALLADLHARRLGRPAPAAPSAEAAPPPTPSAPVPVVRFSPPAPPPERLDELLFPLEIDLAEIDRAAPVPLPPIPLFSELAPGAFRPVLDRARPLRLQPGELAVRQGERGDALSIVVRGELEVVREGAAGSVRLARLADGAFFGEMSLLTGQPRAASVRALRETDLLQLGAADLRQLVSDHPSVGTALRRFYRQRLLANVLATSPLFRPFEPATRAALVGRFRTREVAGGEAVVREGVPVDGLFVVLHGAFTVVRGPPGAEKQLGVLRDGDLFGERSLLHGGPARATCRALGRGMILRLPREAFAAWAGEHPEIRRTLDRIDLQRQLGDEADGGEPQEEGGSVLV